MGPSLAQAHGHSQLETIDSGMACTPPLLPHRAGLCKQHSYYEAAALH